jgi:hypothetical protein
VTGVTSVTSVTMSRFVTFVPPLGDTKSVTSVTKAYLRPCHVTLGVTAGGFGEKKGYPHVTRQDPANASRRPRLARAHRMLSDPRLAGLTVSAIAYAAGFRDLPHLRWKPV